MTARQRLPSDREIKRVINTLRDLGVQIGAVDIRADGVTVHPPTESGGGSAYDRWKAKDKNRDEAPHCH
jgi:hypothetical protein